MFNNIVTGSFQQFFYSIQRAVQKFVVLIVTFLFRKLKSIVVIFDRVEKKRYFLCIFDI